MKKASETANPLVLDGFASVREACELLSISRAKLYGLMQDGELCFAKVGASRRIPWRALHQYMEKCMQVA
jgi:excisionase family DNA binding protein